MLLHADGVIGIGITGLLQLPLDFLLVELLHLWLVRSETISNLVRVQFKTTTILTIVREDVISMCFVHYGLDK